MSSTVTGSRDAHRPRISQVVGALVVAIAWLGVSLLPLRGLPRTLDEAPGLDAHIYIAMAESPSVFTMPPFGYRIGTPLLVHLLPLPIETAFFAVTFVALLAVLVLAYVFLRQLGFSHGLALLGLSFVAAAPEISRYLRNYFLVDPTALAVMTALLIGIERRWPSGRLALLLLIGSLFKESAFFVVPVLYLRGTDRWIDGRAALRTLAIATPAILASLVLRFHWGGTVVDFPYVTPWSVPRRAWFGSMDSFRDIWQNFFGFLPLLAVANAFDKEWRGFARRYGPYLALVVAQLIVPMNEDRLPFFAYPAIVPLALVEFRTLGMRIPSWLPLLATLLVFCYLFAPGEWIAPLVIVGLGRLLSERAQ